MIINFFANVSRLICQIWQIQIMRGDISLWIIGTLFKLVISNIRSLWRMRVPGWRNCKCQPNVLYSVSFFFCYRVIHNSPFPFLIPFCSHCNHNLNLQSLKSVLHFLKYSYNRNIIRDSQLIHDNVETILIYIFIH